jgi:hypothetical protein
LLIAAQRDAAQRDQDRRLEAGRYCLTGSQLNALERVPGRVEEAVEQMQAIIDVLMTEAGQTVASRRRASSMLRCVDDAIARLPFAADLGRERIIADRHHDFLFYGSPVLMAHVLARVLEASLNEACTKTGADLVLALGHSAGRNYLRLTDSMADFRGIGSRLLSGVFRRDRDMNFEKRPDLALANFVLERMGGMVVRSLLLGHAQETMFWFPQVATELDPRDRSD